MVSGAGRTWLLTGLALVAFAANSLLCRLALATTSIDPTTFTSVRMVSGAVVLWLLTRRRPLLRFPALAALGSSRAPAPAALGLLSIGRPVRRSGSLAQSGSWASALALFGYALTFSYAYVSLSAATGALLLFGAVQATMIGYGLYRGERFRGLQWPGFIVAVAGLIGLLLPGVTAPPLLGAALMIAAGGAWGIYSLRGKGSKDPALTTASNFIRAVPAAVVTSAIALPWLSADAYGLGYAFVSGALTSGMGYVIWYAALPSLSAPTAATVQLSVPVLAALGGVIVLGETMTTRLAIASVAIIGGIALVVAEGARVRR